MFDATITPDGVVRLTGRLDASQAEKAASIFNNVTHSAVVDFQELEYISSAGLGVLLMTQKRLRDAGHGLKLVNMTKHTRDVFQYAGFDKVFEIG